MGFNITDSNPRWRPINPKVKLAYMLREYALIFSDERLIVDCRPVVLKSCGHMYVGNLLIEEIYKNFRNTTIVVGSGFDGFAMASAIACMSQSSNCHHIDAMYFNKDERVTEGNPDDADNTAVVVCGSTSSISDDDVTTITESGYKVVSVMALVDNGHDVKNVPVHALFTIDSIDSVINEWECGIDYP